MQQLQPTLFLPHGGGPCFFMDWDPPETWEKMRAFLAAVIGNLAQRPRQILLITAHWEAERITLSNNPNPELLFDYNNFPPHTYELRWPAPGAPDLARRAADLLADAGISTAFDATRGYDHGVFVPMKVALPDADIPVAMMSLRADLDPRHHLDAGSALAPLRAEGVLIIGSGMSSHNLRAFVTGHDNADADLFDAWLQAVVTGDPLLRDAALTGWAAAPGARAAHPREDHLLPLMVAAGAAGENDGICVYAETLMGARQSAFRFG